MKLVLLVLLQLQVFARDCPETHRFTFPDTLDEAQIQAKWPGLKPEGFQVCDFTSATDHKVIVEISSHRLRWYENNRLKAEFRMSAGRGGDLDKQVEGDERTPWGIFYITHRNPNSAFFRSLGLSYPNLEDASRGLREKIITMEQFVQIRRAIQNLQLPPQNTALGGAIMLHGEPNWLSTPGFLDGIKDSIITMKHWTRGCVAVTNKNMTEIFEKLPTKSRVIILP